MRKINSYARLGSNGLILSESLPHISELVDLTYAELTGLITNSGLSLNSMYRITDYRTTYLQPVSNEYMESEVEPILVTALSENKLAPEAYSTIYPQDQIYYDINNNQDMVPGCVKGYIYRRIDTKQNNDFPFDFRNVKFRRWEIDIPNWSTYTDYELGTMLSYMNSQYIATKSPNIPYNPSNAAYWTNFDLEDERYVSPTPNSWDALHFTCTENYQDFTICADPQYYNNWNNNKFELNSSNLLGNCNLVIFKGSYHGMVDNRFEYNTLGSTIYNTTICSFGFCNNIVGNYFIDNLLGGYMAYNTFGHYFQSNMSAGKAFSGSFYNNKFDGAYGNKFGVNFANNIFSNNLRDSMFTGSFSYNTVGINFWNNFISSESICNNIGHNFKDNVIGSRFNYNVVLNDVNSNKIGADFKNNYIEDKFIGNTVGSGFKFARVGYNLNANGPLDFSSSTIVYNDYFKELLINIEGTPVIKYLNATNVEVIASAVV